MISYMIILAIAVVAYFAAKSVVGSVKNGGCPGCSGGCSCNSSECGCCGGQKR